MTWQDVLLAIGFVTAFAAWGLMLLFLNHSNYILWMFLASMGGSIPYVQSQIKTVSKDLPAMVAPLLLAAISLGGMIYKN